MLNIMLSAGEASGDLHGAAVARALKTIAPDCRLFGMGGKHMREAGVEILYDIADLGVIGVVEVIRSLPRLFRLRDQLAAAMDERRPDALVVIDYPGFNMRLAKVAKEKGIPIISYISPSAWAWGKGRAREVAQTVSKVAAIFPFEADVYREVGADVEFVGHPLLDIVRPSMPKEEAYRYFDADSGKPVVLLLPGSRRQEIENLLPLMLEAATIVSQTVSGVQYYLPVAATIPEDMIKRMLAQYSLNVKTIRDNIYDLMQISQAAIAASGTVTLEAALMNVPSVIIYRLNFLTYWLGKWLVKIPHIGLPNIIAGRQVIPELVQDAARPEEIAAQLQPLLADGEKRTQVLADLALVRQKLGERGAVERVAQTVLTVARVNREGVRE
ncbi:lipid-A-disaccharide synthase [Acetonema longum]|uniref:Lipid-A-disaccharide synthase n=1 Tax=Acetonema longum DSM 6540 TaxID=1009370 RepID=F7NM09_9FIRM|nr:lipid-A-disaccharide synthase [Acetonema longum]EGO62935.1 lipid-A-disaccharide synthase [Acetonema longum DSM 6540]